MSSYVTAKWGVHGLVRTLQIESRTTPGHRHLASSGPAGSTRPSTSRPAPTSGGTVGRRRRSTRRRRSPDASSRRWTVRVARVCVGPANRIVVAGFQLLPAVFDAMVTPLMRVGGLSRDEAPHSPGNVLSPLPHGEALHGRWGRHWLRPVTGAAALAHRRRRPPAHLDQELT